MLKFRSLLYTVVVGAGILSFAGCEELVDPDGLPFVERLVVRGILTPDGKPDTIVISKTEPLTAPTGDENDPKILSGVTGAVYEGSTAYPLKQVTGGYVAEGLNVEEGKTYRLSIDWKDKHAEATTRIPIATPIDSASVTFVQREPNDYSDEDDIIHLTFAPRQNQVYIITWANIYTTYNDKNIQPFNYDSRVIRYGDRDSDGKIKVDHRFYYYFSIGDTSRRISAMLYSFDEPYYEYYLSQRSYTSSEDPLSGGSHMIRWNVTGDGIGMFIGQTITEKEVQ